MLLHFYFRCYYIFISGVITFLFQVLLHFYFRCYYIFISGVKIFIDSKALMTIIGTEMDYTTNKLSSEFVFANPNVKGTCGCGESFSV